MLQRVWGCKTAPRSFYNERNKTPLCLDISSLTLIFSIFPLLISLVFSISALIHNKLMDLHFYLGFFLGPNTPHGGKTCPNQHKSDTAWTFSSTPSKCSCQHALPRSSVMGWRETRKTDSAEMYGSKLKNKASSLTRDTERGCSSSWSTAQRLCSSLDDNVKPEEEDKARTARAAALIITKREF